MATVTLRVLTGSHNHFGTEYEAGQTFSGSESLLVAFADKLELAKEVEAVEPAPVAQPVKRKRVK